MGQAGSRFYVLDSFRGLCALCVVFFHAHVVGTLTEWAFFRRADYFVDFFFVLSGFVIAHRYLLWQNTTLSSYLISRFFRIFPLHLLFLLAFLCVELLKSWGARYGLDLNKGPNQGSLWAELSCNAVLLQSWIPGCESQSFNYPAWSVSVEFYIYVLFGALALARVRRYAPIVLFWVVSLAGLVMSEGGWPHEIFRGTAGFFSGVVTYMAFSRLGRRWCVGRYSTVIEAMMVCVVVAAVTLDYSFKPLAVLLVFCLAIGCFAHEWGGLSRVLKWRPFVWLGELSYAIYMAHASVLVLVLGAGLLYQKATGEQVVPMLNGIRYFDLGSLNGLLLGGIVLSVVLLAWIIHCCVEKPFIRMGKAVAFRQAAKGPGATQ